MRHTNFPTIPELFCIALFLAFVCALGYMGFNVSRHPIRDVTMQTITDSSSLMKVVPVHDPDS